MTTHLDRLPIPYPLEAPGSVLADRPGFALAIRGIGLSDAGLSFSVHILTTLLGHPRDAQEVLDTGRPFCGPDRTPDPAGLTVSCQWRYTNESQWIGDVDRIEPGETPVVGGAWNWNSPEIAEGYYTLQYPLIASTVEEITISLSWTVLGFDLETVRVNKEAIASTLLQKSR